MKRIRIKVDITADVEDIDDMKQRVIDLLQGNDDVEFPNHKTTDGWCVGRNTYWHLVSGCYGLTQ